VLTLVVAAALLFVREELMVPLGREAVPEGVEMEQQTVEKIASMLEEMPEQKAAQVVDYLEFIRWSDDIFREDEIMLIQEARTEAKDGKGTEWRAVRDDV
jgi:hypothetical protein